MNALKHIRFSLGSLLLLMVPVSVGAAAAGVSSRWLVVFLIPLLGAVAAPNRYVLEQHRQGQTVSLRARLSLGLQGFLLGVAADLALWLASQTGAILWEGFIGSMEPRWGIILGAAPVTLAYFAIFRRLRPDWWLSDPPTDENVRETPSATPATTPRPGSGE